jgi:hypothetical protein
VNIEEILNTARTKRISRMFKESLLDCLWVLGEQPANPEALRLIEDILQTVTYRERKYRLDNTLLEDPRMNKFFSQCDKCGAYWFPDNTRKNGDLMLSTDPGGYDPISKQHFCAKCVVKSGSVIKSPLSGKLMTVSPKPTGRDIRKAKLGGSLGLDLPLPRIQRPVSTAKLTAAFIFKIGNPNASTDDYLNEVAKALIPEYDSSSSLYLEVLNRAADTTTMYSRITSRIPRFAEQDNFDIFWQEFPDGFGSMLTIAKIFEKL